MAQQQLTPPSDLSIELLKDAPVKEVGAVTEEEGAVNQEAIKLSSESVFFEEIEKNGLNNGCYPDVDHYVAEFLFQNPEVCYWSADAVAQTVTPVPTPTPPADAVKLPPPSGGDDTRALQGVINSNGGGSVVGVGVYKVSNLVISVPIDIYNMPISAPSGATEIVQVASPDVRIFNSPIDANNFSSVHIGYHVNHGAHRFNLVNSGVSNISHKNDKNAAGVYLRGVDDFHLACNAFENIINSTSTSVTARANAIWMNGAGSETTSGGYIVNNTAINHQSNGRLKDAEFFTEQSYENTDPQSPVRIFGNKALNAGKRFTKHQESNALVLSNENIWSTKEGPLGNRTLLSHVEVHFSNNIIARNNRVVVGAQSRFDYILNTDMHIGSEIQNNIHYDCNDIEIQDKLSSSSGNRPVILVARASRKAKESSGFEATNSSASNNRIHGAGSVSSFYWFGPGYEDYGGKFEAIGNTFSIDHTGSEYKTP